jgi:glycosyltransferase involved in cell wall biosynthesis
MVKSERIEVIHTHDLPMVSIGRAVARAHGIPLVADLHENWPAALASYGYARRFPGRLLISPARWARHEREILPHAQRIIVVIEEAKDRLVEIGIDPGKIAVVRNTVEVDEFRSFGMDPSIAERFTGRFVLCYLGGFERHRGLEMAVEAMPLLARLVPQSLLLLVGGGSTEAALRAMAERLGVSDRVVFEGWQPFHRFPSYIQASQVCLIPHVRNDHTDTTIPHKLFQTMLLGRPVLVSDCRPLRRIVEETGCGLIVPSGDAEAFAAAAAALADTKLREPMAAAGRRAVLERYHWGRDAATLLEVYQSLARA